MSYSSFVKLSVRKETLADLLDNLNARIAAAYKIPLAYLLGKAP